MNFNKLGLGKWFLGVMMLGLVVVAAKSMGTKSKVGYINTNELWALMPEKKAADEQLKNMETQMVAYLQQEQKSFEDGVSTYVKDSASMTELVKKQTIQKLTQQQENIKNLPKAANEELMKKQEELYAPIKEKMQKAIDEVAAENGYDFIFDAAFGNIVFVKDEGDNVLALVKSKLNL